MHDIFHIFTYYQAKPKKLEAEIAGKEAETAGKEAEFAGHRFHA